MTSATNIVNRLLESDDLGDSVEDFMNDLAAGDDEPGIVNYVTSQTANHFYHRTKKYGGRRSDEPIMVRRSGKTKTWKTRPGHFQIPVKYGMYDNGYITHENAHEWSTIPIRPKWKIQAATANGWADLKSAVDDGPRQDDFYDSEQEAERERRSLPDPNSYRVVTSDTPQDDDLYA